MKAARLAVVLLVVGCDLGFANNLMPPGVDAGPTGSGGAGGAGGAASGTGGSGGSMADGGVVAPSGLPCDVDNLLQSRCQSCHFPGAAVLPLVTYADLTAMSPAYPTQTVAERCLARMQDAASPMPAPPSTPPTAAEIAIIQNWVTAGTPTGSCAASAPDGGTDPYGTPPVCTSNRYWTSGNSGSSNMHPGGACIQCHAQNGDPPRFTFAGTVYPTAHEPIDCYGATPAQIVVTDAQNQTVTVNANSAGNFSYQGAIATPFQVKVVVNGRERAMVTPLTTGDCNACHTQNGASGAPGRVLLP